MASRTRPDLAERNRRSATHRMTDTPTYNVWCSMRQRCENPQRKDFPRYGGAGVRVCDQWASFDAFLRDMGQKPEGMTLDRIDGAGNYEPSNCRWATRKQQARNRSSNVLLTHEGRTATIAEWAEKTGLERKTIEHRIRAGWEASRALTTASLINRKASHV